MFVAKEDLKTSALGLIEGETNRIANLANLTALIYHSLPDLNWAGFYLWNDESQELVLGPFQGKPACVRIKSGRGVCGAAFASKTAQIVFDVHTFPGHIACDEASRSELVLPIVVSGQCVGVLDLDSPSLGRFSEKDLQLLQPIVDLLSKCW